MTLIIIGSMQVMPKPIRDVFPGINMFPGIDYAYVQLCQQGDMREHG